ncbi:MAG TPA: hypothetical protein DCL44_04895 [Elusimicrobia bacterium]|nr:hypothetical protein [Elusimicrobiota bacterium]
MKMQVGIGSFRELDYFLAAGAGEFYCGLDKIPSHVEGACNFGSLDDILTAARLVHAAGGKMFFAANEVHASLLEETGCVIRELANGGIDGVIIKDLALLDLLKRRGIKTAYILSTLSCCMNAATLAVYRGYGVKRLALPEQLNPAETRELVCNSWGIVSEVFLKARECCRNFNGLCFLDCHGKQSNTCGKSFRREGGGVFRMPGFSPEEHMAQLHDYYHMGVGVLKVGRSPRPETSRLVFKEALLLLDLLKSGLGRKAFTGEALRVHTVFDKAYRHLIERV